MAAALRLWDLGGLSYWYDEVVTVSLARTSGPLELFRLLGRIDATRAPLHPLLLQVWIRLFGASEAAARSLSVACGVATVGAVYALGRDLFDRRTGLIAAWLAAVCPPLVQYSREARMYAALVLATTVAWWLLASFGRAAGWKRRAAFAVMVAVPIYLHPLGLLMAGALAAGFVLLRPGLRLGWRGWLATQATAAMLVAPWVRHYFDHPPEWVAGRLPLRFFIGLPIGFVGGDRWALLACGAVVAVGMVRFDRRVGAVLAWFVLPPGVLYGYSLVGHPLFGPARYTLFVAPAYLLLLARGLARLPRWVRGGLLLGGLVLSGAGLARTVYAPGLKADWRGAARVVRGPAAVVVLSADGSRNVEVETARYYLGGLPGVVVMRPEEARRDDGRPGDVIVAVGLRDGVPGAEPPASGEALDLPGLRLIFRFRSPLPPGEG